MNLILLIKYWKWLAMGILSMALTVSLFFTRYYYQRYTHIKTEVEVIQLSQINQLQEQLRNKEQLFYEQQVRNQQQKELKQNEINELSNQLQHRNASLYQFTKTASNASKSLCNYSSSTSSQPTVNAIQPSKTSEELTGQMANDLAELLEECASNYERLKADTYQLQQWANEVALINKTPIRR